MQSWEFSLPDLHLPLQNLNLPDAINPVRLPVGIFTPETLKNTTSILILSLKHIVLFL